MAPSIAVVTVAGLRRPPRRQRTGGEGHVSVPDAVEVAIEEEGAGGGQIQIRIEVVDQPITVVVEPIAALDRGGMDLIVGVVAVELVGHGPRIGWIDGVLRISVGVSVCVEPGRRCGGGADVQQRPQIQRVHDQGPSYEALATIVSSSRSSWR